MGDAAPGHDGLTDLGALARRAAAARERWGAVEAAVAGVRVERSSPGAEVHVTVDAEGRLADVRFGDRVRTTPPDRLAELLLAAVRAAQGALVDEVAAAVDADGVADAPETTRALLDGYRRRFPPAAGVGAAGVDAAGVDAAGVDAAGPPAPAGASWLR